MPLLKKEYHLAIYIFGLLVLALSIPLSRYLMSVAQMILIGNWVLEGNIPQKLKTFFRNKPAWIFASIYLLHLLGLFITSDFEYSLKDLRVKIPLALLPLILSSSTPLQAKWFNRVLVVYLLGVFTGTVVGSYIFATQSITDTRVLSPFISHIRFSLNLCLALVILLWFLVISRQTMPLLARTGGWILFCWMLAYIYVSQYFTTYYILGSLVFAWLISQSLLTKKPLFKTGLLFTTLAILVMGIWYLYAEYRQFFQEDHEPGIQLEAFTTAGNLYRHDTLNPEVISGHRVWWYISDQELEAAWQERSAIPYDSLGRSGLKISDVLIRYLTSRGLRKDAGGLAALSEKEIFLIESGCADVEETRGSPVHKRLRKFFWEYQNYRLRGDPSGHSVMMRLEYWKASVAIIKQNWIIGVGTGDMNLVFDHYYQEVDSKLGPEWRRRSHNQFLSVTVGFGILGLLWFLFALFYPACTRKSCFSFLFGSFFLILLLSFLPEDTIESQDGVTFTAFFFSFLLFARKEKSP